MTRCTSATTRTGSRSRATCSTTAASGSAAWGGGGKHGDRFNIVSNSICRNHRLWGISASGGKNNVISGSIRINSSQQKPGRCAGIQLEHTTDTLVIGNPWSNEGESAIQGYGILEQGRSDRNLIIDNLCTGNVTADVSVVGSNTQLSGNAGKVVRAEP